MSIPIAIACVAALAVAHGNIECFQIISVPALAYVLLWAGFGFHLKIFAWCDRMDLSYGT